MKKQKRIGIYFTKKALLELIAIPVVQKIIVKDFSKSQRAMLVAELFYEGGAK